MVLSRNITAFDPPLAGYKTTGKKVCTRNWEGRAVSIRGHGVHMRTRPLGETDTKSKLCFTGQLGADFSPSL